MIFPGTILRLRVREPLAVSSGRWQITSSSPESAKGQEPAKPPQNHINATSMSQKGEGAHFCFNWRREFHGYAGRDFYRVDPHWGTLADLQHMVRAAHARGILVIDDVIVNHVGDLVDSGDLGYPRFKPPPNGYTLRWHNPNR